MMLLHSNAQWAPQTLYNTSNGLINNRTGSVAQDEAGYMWLGTDNGISCYDGRKFHFFSGSKRKFYFAHSYLNFYKQYILMGTGREGLALCYKNKVIFKRFQNYEHTSINSAFAIDDSTFLLATNQKKGLLLLEGMKLRTIQLPKAIEQSAEQYLVLIEDKQKNIWLGTDKGLIVFPKGNLKNPIIPSQTKGLYINVIKADSRGKVYISTDNSIIASPNQLTNIDSNLHFETIVPKSKVGFISIAFDKEDNVYLGYDYDKFLAVKALKRNGTTLNFELNNNQFAWDIFFDREDNLWLATENGVVKMPRLAVKNFSASSKDYPVSKSGLLMNDGSFLANLGNKIFCLKDNDVKQYTASEEIIPGYIEERFHQTSDGKLWMSNYDTLSPIVLYETRNCVLKNEQLIIGNQIQQYGGPKCLNMEIAVRDSIGRSFFSELDASFWMYSQGRFYSVKSKNSKKPIDSIQAFAVTKEGDILGLNNRLGLMQMDITKENNVYHAEAKQSLYIDSLAYCGYKKLLVADDGKIWMTTTFKKGILIFQKSKDGFYLLADSIVPDRFSSYILRDICQDSKGNIYVGSNLGIDKISKNAKGAYQIEKGVFKTELTGTYIYYLRIINDILFVGTTGSFARIDLNKYKINQCPPQVYITGLQVNSVDKDALLETNGIIHLDAGQNTLQFTFIAPSFINEKEVKYKYMLEGVDANWSLPDYSYSTTYSQLKPGKYTFKVMALNAEGLWSKGAASFSFVIKSPFYAQWWFILLIILLSLAFLYWIYRIQIAKAIAVERTRQKISKDLHDDVGSTLSSITLMNALLRKKIKSNPEDASRLAEKVEETSRDMIRNISDIVWSTNPENDTIDKMQFRLRQFAADVFEPKGIAYKIVFDKEILKQELNMDVKHDLFLICKEIINNAAKYSAAEHFSISFTYSKNKIHINAEDDGVGIDWTKKMRGNGLLNIRQRVKNQKGIAEFNSKPNEGTQWMIQIPI